MVLRSTCLISALAMLLAGCAPVCHRDALGYVALYRTDGASGKFVDPGDTWIDNHEIAFFLSNNIKSDGVGVLTAKYGMQCVPAADTASCADCLVCTTSRRQNFDAFGFSQAATTLERSASRLKSVREAAFAQ